jgi:hypothetical protein
MRLEEYGMVTRRRDILARRAGALPPLACLTQRRTLWRVGILANRAIVVDAPKTVRLRGVVIPASFLPRASKVIA